MRLTDDPDAYCFRVTAPDGYMFEPGLHELRHIYGPHMDTEKAVAFEWALESLRDWEVEPCNTVDCGWC